MRTLLLTAPRAFPDAGIPKGFTIQVITATTGTPHPKEIKEALHRYGFSGPRVDSWASAGNWKITELK